VRKFACFAVGNAGFHSSKLYKYLRPCVPLLIKLLKDREEKTRANAAGALGNFVRNSNTLIPDLIGHGALFRLVEIISAKNQTSLSAVRIALFSIGNLCAYPECRKVFEEQNVREIVSKFSVRLSPSSRSSTRSAKTAKCSSTPRG
jgi:fused